MIILQDSNGFNWTMHASGSGRVSMVRGGGPAGTLNLQDSSGHVWQIIVTITGGLSAVPSVLTSAPTQVSIAPSNFGISILLGGRIEISPLAPSPVVVQGWIPNGWGAGTDNRIVGGLGGFLAYPQPPFPVGVGPEANGQFGSLNFTYSSGATPQLGNYFILSNPGRQG